MQEQLLCLFWNHLFSIVIAIVRFLRFCKNTNPVDCRYSQSGFHCYTGYVVNFESFQLVTNCRHLFCPPEQNCQKSVCLPLGDTHCFPHQS
jgi:hypothetical protein